MSLDAIYMGVLHTLYIAKVNDIDEYEENL